MAQLLEIEGLRKAFPQPGGGGALPVVDVPAFALGAGEAVALTGTSGSGKTTFLNLVAGIVRADAGRVVLGGREVTALREPARDRWRALQVGYLFQTFNLLEAYTALENVILGMAFGPGAERSTAAALLGRVGLGDRLSHRPGQLSQGQRQRVALARALANRPALVLADEPTGNLDPASAAGALDLLTEMCRESGAGLLLVTHDESVAGRVGRRVRWEELNRAGEEPAPCAPGAPAGGEGGATG